MSAELDAVTALAVAAHSSEPDRAKVSRQREKPSD